MNGYEVQVQYEDGGAPKKKKYYTKAKSENEAAAIIVNNMVSRGLVQSHEQVCILEVQAKEIALNQ